MEKFRNAIELYVQISERVIITYYDYSIVTKKKHLRKQNKIIKKNIKKNQQYDYCVCDFVIRSKI